MNYKIEHSIHLEFDKSRSEGSLKLWVPTPLGTKAEYSIPPDSSKELLNLGCRINYWNKLPLESLVLKSSFENSGIARTPSLSKDFIAKALSENKSWVEVSEKIKKLPMVEEIKSLKDEEKIAKIKEFILSFIKYEYPPETRVAEEVLDVGKSDCGGYHALFVALSRSVGVSAVMDFGFRALSDQAHVWAWWFNKESKKWVMEDLNDEQSKRVPTDRVSFVLGTNPKLIPAYPRSVLFLQSHLVWIEDIDRLKTEGFSFRHYPSWVVSKSS